MNTYETMKHNIPEGATHYRDGSDEFRFSWVMFDDGGALNVYTTALGWCRFNHSKFEDKVKPIPTIPTEAPEEKEALDDKTYRYEKVTDSIFDLKRAEFERGELFTKKFNEELHVIKSEPQLGRLLDMNDDPKKNGIYRRIEVTERELFIEEAHKAILGVPRCMDVCVEHLGAMYDAGCRFVNGKG